MKEKRVTFLNSKGQKLVGYYYKSKSKSLIISCHGTHPYSAFPKDKVDEVFDFYHKLGFSVIRFDFTGYGESEGKISLIQRIDDIKSVVKEFGKGYKEIILSVISLAAVTAVISASENKKITKLIITNGAFSFQRIDPFIWLQLQLYVLFHPWIKKEIDFVFNTFNSVGLKIPTLILYSENDKIVSPSQSIEFYNQLKTDKTLKKIPHADHYISDKKSLDVGNAITKNWFAKYNLPR